MLRKALKAVLFFSAAFSFQVFADDASKLKDCLQVYSALSADFEQTVTKKDGSVISKTKGNLALKKPDNFILHTTEPDEQVLFTKGRDVYFYDPFVNQVTIFDKSSIYTSPFALLTSTDDSVWKNYKVTESGNGFELIPMSNAQLTKIILILDNGALSQLKVTFKDGNTSHYRFSSVSPSAKGSVFDYKLPADVQVDDERRSR
ncbi:MAG: outer membrane lipoprotein chaperone LolA [Succinivibrio sp.]